MTTTQHQYQFVVSGNADVVQAIQDIERASRNAAKSTGDAYMFPLTRQQQIAAKSAELERIVQDSSHKSAAGVAKFGAALGDAESLVNGLARDIDVLGDGTGAVAAKMVGDIVGIGQAFLSGPLGIGIATATTAVTLLAKGFAELEASERAASEAAERFAEDQRRSINATVQSILDARKAVTDEHVLAVEVEREFTRQNIDNTREALEEVVALKAEAAQFGADAVIAAAQAERELTDKLRVLERDEKRHDGELDLLYTKQNSQEKIKVDLAEAQLREDLANKERDRSRRHADEMKKLAEQQAREMAQLTRSGQTGFADDGEFQKYAAEVQDESLQMATSLGMTKEAFLAYVETVKRESGPATDALRALNEAYGQGFVTWEQSQEALAKEEEARLLVVDATDLFNERERQRRDEMHKSAVVTMQGAAINTAYANSMFVLGSGVDFVAGKLERFGQINRDNAADMLRIRENTVAAIVAETQAHLWSLGVQAGKRALFEVAEYGREAALGFGKLAMDDYKGAALHFMSAAIHGHNVSAYGALGGGAAGVSLGIGMSRGNGGLFALTDAEKERNTKTDNSSAPSGGGGVSGGTGVSGRRDQASQTVQIIYMPGAVNAADDKHLQRSVARGQRGARRDGFLSEY